RKPALQGRAFVPRIELLEDRTVLSTWTVTNPADSGDASLRAAIAAWLSNETINSPHGSSPDFLQGRGRFGPNRFIRIHDGLAQRRHGLVGRGTDLSQG